MRAGASAGLLLVLLASSSCVSNAGGGSAAAPTARATDAVTRLTVRPGTARGYVGARADVSRLTCGRSGGDWLVAGEVTNPTSTAATYRIYTSFLTSDGRTGGLLQTDVVAVAAAQTRGWRGRLPLSGASLTCVLRVERSQA